MPNLIAKKSDFVSRGTHFNRVLEYIIKNPAGGGPSWSHKPYGGGISIVARDKEIGEDINSWRFNTFHNLFRAHYHELWYPIDNKEDRWYLQRVYLNIYHIDRENRTETEFILLHSDPEEIIVNDKSVYKKSPHLHFKIAGDPIGKAHIALLHMHIEEIINNNLFFETFREFVKLIRLEVLDRIPEK